LARCAVQIWVTDSVIAGWLILSSQKHAQFHADELVAIIYHGYLELLEDLSHAVEPDV
jgi:hypothetical protein